MITISDDNLDTVTVIPRNEVENYKEMVQNTKLKIIKTSEYLGLVQEAEFKVIENMGVN